VARFADLALGRAAAGDLEPWIGVIVPQPREVPVNHGRLLVYEPVEVVRVELIVPEYRELKSHVVVALSCRDSLSLVRLATGRRRFLPASTIGRKLHEFCEKNEKSRRRDSCKCMVTKG